MCGFSGYIGKREISQKIIDSTLDLMKERGPDSQDFFFDKSKNDQLVYLLSSRLSIVNQNSNSNQPFKIYNYIIVYNGEIYNYKKLKKNLESQGVKFKTSSDTEIILRYFIKYGSKCTNYFEGMWSFVIYNTYNSKFFFSRDRFGEKPFYTFKTKDGFYFGSEIKFIKNLYYNKIEINKNQIINYLNLGYKSLYKYNETYYKNIVEFPKASYSCFQDYKSIEIKKYWKLSYKKNNKINLDEAIKSVREKLTQSISDKIDTKVSVGICLSGGVDSSIIASVAKKILNKDVDTYSIIDEDVRYSESETINYVIQDLKLRNHKVKIKKNNNLNKIERLVDYRSAPVATISYYNHSLMLEKMKKDKLKVGVLGTAADEIFGGYFDHYLLQLAVLFKENMTIYHQQKEHFNNTIKKFIRNNLLQDPDKYVNSPNDREHIFDERDKINFFLKKKSSKIFIEKNFSKDILRNRMINELLIETTPVILNEDDLNSMNYSIENRSPFLDRSLVEYAFKLPTKYLIKDGYNKYLLRQAFKDVVDKRVILNKKKSWF